MCTSLEVQKNFLSVGPSLCLATSSGYFQGRGHHHHHHFFMHPLDVSCGGHFSSCSDILWGLDVFASSTSYLEVIF